MDQVWPNLSPADAELGAGFDPSLSSRDVVGDVADGEDALFSVAVLEDGGFRFEGFSSAAERLTGIPNAELIDRTPDDVLPPASAAVVLARYRQCVHEDRAISYLETLEFPSGTSDWRTTLQPIRDDTGRVVRLLGRSRQIEPLSSTREDLTEAEFNRALDLFPLGFAVLDEQGVILFLNRAWHRFGEKYGGAGAAVGGTYVEACGMWTSAGLPDGPEVAAKLEQLRTDDVRFFHHRYAWRDRHFLLRATRFTLNGKMRFALAHQDVTDITLAQQQAAMAAENLIVAQEEERARIALELHDSTSQHLVALGLSLAKLRRTTAAPPEVIDDMRRSLTEAHREIRTLTYLLYPPKLSSQGLVATLRSFADGFQRRTGLSVATTTFGPLDDLPVEAQLAVLRVVQEALANANRHAGARRLAIEVVLKKRGLRLTVVDDGQTALSGDGPQPTGVGIRGMQARFAQLGGELTVTHRPFGTVVDGRLPPQAATPRRKVEPARRRRAAGADRHERRLDA